MESLQLLVDLHKGGKRQGPGSIETTQRALNLLDIYKQKKLSIADIGCGTGASTIQIARQLDGGITAIDIFPEFLEKKGIRMSPPHDNAFCFQNWQI